MLSGIRNLWTQFVRAVSPGETGSTEPVTPPSEEVAPEPSAAQTNPALDSFVEDLSRQVTLPGRVMAMFRPRQSDGTPVLISPEVIRNAFGTYEKPFDIQRGTRGYRYPTYEQQAQLLKLPVLIDDLLQAIDESTLNEEQRKSVRGQLLDIVGKLDNPRLPIQQYFSLRAAYLPELRDATLAFYQRFNASPHYDDTSKDIIKSYLLSGLMNAYARCPALIEEPTGIGQREDIAVFQLKIVSAWKADHGIRIPEDDRMEFYTNEKSGKCGFGPKQLAVLMLHHRDLVSYGEFTSLLAKMSLKRLSSDTRYQYSKSAADHPPDHDYSLVEQAIRESTKIPEADKEAYRVEIVYEMARRAVRGS